MNVNRFGAMGCDVVVAGGDPARVAAVLEQWEDTFSLFRGGSEICRVNRAPQPAVPVSRLFARALAAALDAAADTGGLVVPARGDVRLVGRFVVRRPGVELDLNGVAKSMAVDDAVAALDGRGFVSVGGDLAVSGPVDVGLPRGGAVRVLEGGLATSGVASRGRHLVDPRTGGPSDSPWEQVTVSGATCLSADVAAKAAFLLGFEGPRWLDERGVPGRFVALDGEVTCTAAWAGSLVCT